MTRFTRVSVPAARDKSTHIDSPAQHAWDPLSSPCKTYGPPALATRPRLDLPITCPLHEYPRRTRLISAPRVAVRRRLVAVIRRRRVAIVRWRLVAVVRRRRVAVV